MMQMCNAYCVKYKKYQGKFLPEVLDETGMTLAELFMDIYKESGRAGTIYTLFDQQEENVPKQMKHSRALYGTDGWYEPSSHQNACTYGTMPKFLRLARETGNMTMEECIAHMTGLTADRYSMHGRGYLKDGYYADIVIFDPVAVADRATVEQSNKYPVGIEHVFVNGEHLFNNGKLNTEIRAGCII